MNGPLPAEQKFRENTGHNLPNLGTVGEIAVILGRSCNVTNNNNDLKFFLIRVIHKSAQTHR